MNLKLTNHTTLALAARSEPGSLLWTKWVPAASLTILALASGQCLPAWVWMWCIALALFLGAKWFTVLRFLGTDQNFDRRRFAAYFFLWPGMNVRAFFAKRAVPAAKAREWLFAGGKMLLGAVLVWVGVPHVTRAHPLAAGWAGMIGVVLLLHFGFFHLLSLIWRTQGINAEPIMHSPATATSLSDFWSVRWNTAFSDLMHEYVFKDLARKIGVVRAVFAVFIVSGLLHELVISIPARSGYGLPTFYFLTQGLGVFVERSRFGRRIGLGRGLIGWCFVMLITCAPAFWLFPPSFIRNVILPMLHAIGAT
jgi:hypothetical protein